MLITLLIFCFVILSGAVLISAMTESSLGDSIPLSMCSIIIILFCFGMAGALSLGVYSVLALALFSAGAGFVRLKKSGKLRDFLHNFKSPAFILFAALAIMLPVFNYGKMFQCWDDFSHWGDVVKVMSTMDVLSTSPLSMSMYPEYPPAMSLFQYFFQKLHMILVPGADFVEWPLYFCYQLLFFSFFIPFTKNLDFKRPYTYVFLLIILISPLTFFAGVYFDLKIDAFLAVVFACLIFEIITCERPDFACCAKVFLYCAVLVLSKNSGIVFAISALIAFVFSLRNFPDLSKKTKRSLALTGAGFVLIPKLMWELSVKLNHSVRAFALPTEVPADTSYRAGALKEFIKGFFTLDVTEPGAIVGGFTTVFLFILLFTMLYFAKEKLGKLCPERRKFFNRIYLLLILTAFIFTGGLALSYLFLFKPEEALTLASYPRYMSSVFLGLLLICFLMVSHFIALGAVDPMKSVLVILCAQTLVTPWMPLVYYVSRNNVDASISQYSMQLPALEHIQSAENWENSRIYILSTDILDNVSLKYYLRPAITNTQETWIPENRPGEPEQWIKELTENYDYLYLVNVEDGFGDIYGELFENPDSIAPQTLYTVDKIAGKLKSVD